MSKAEAIAVSRAVETLLIRENHRFMAEIREALSPAISFVPQSICWDARGLSISSLDFR